MNSIWRLSGGVLFSARKFHLCDSSNNELCGLRLMVTLADPEGGLRGCNPPLNFHKIVVIRVAVVIYLVVTSSNNVYLCALNGVVIGYYSMTVNK